MASPVRGDCRSSSPTSRTESGFTASQLDTEVRAAQRVARVLFLQGRLSARERAQFRAAPLLLLLDVLTGSANLHDGTRPDESNLQPKMGRDSGKRIERGIALTAFQLLDDLEGYTDATRE